MGVEPICKVLSREAGIAISPSGYYDSKGRPQSERAVHDMELKTWIVKSRTTNGMAAAKGGFACPD